MKLPLAVQLRCGYIPVNPFGIGIMYMTVIDRVSEFHAGIPTDGRLNEVVGGWICTAARVPSSERPGISIDVYCNDEGLLTQLPINHVTQRTNQWIAGNLILVASNRDGETIPATQTELQVAYHTAFSLLREPLVEYGWL